VKKVKKIKFKSVLGAILFAFALWAYTSLNGEFITKVSFPVTVELPENRAIENPLPTEVLVEVKGTGWHLFNLLYFNNTKQCNIDLSRVDISNKSFNISQSTLLKSLDNLVNVEARSVNPESLELRTGSVGEYNVPITPNVNIIPKEGFTIVGNIDIVPSMVKISGNDKLVQNIKHWTTQYITISDVNKPFRAEVALSDSLSSIVKLSSPKVEILANVQLIAEKVIPDVEIEIVGGQLPYGHILLPKRIDVIIRGGINIIESIKPESIKAFVDINTILEDKVGIITPQINIPKYVQLLNNNLYLYHYYETKNLTQNTP